MHYTKNDLILMPHPELNRLMPLLPEQFSYKICQTKEGSKLYWKCYVADQGL